MLVGLQCLRALRHPPSLPPLYAMPYWPSNKNSLHVLKSNDIVSKPVDRFGYKGANGPFVPILLLQKSLIWIFCKIKRGLTYLNENPGLKINGLNLPKLSQINLQWGCIQICKHFIEIIFIWRFQKINGQNLKLD